MHRYLALLTILVTSALSEAQDFTYTTINGTIQITGYTGAGGDVIIPSTINGLPVTDLHIGAFYYNSNVTSVTIPDSFTKIATGAFISCLSLTNITIPNSVTSIGDLAFQSCTNLISVTIPSSVTSLGVQAFQLCFALRGVYFEGNPTRLVGMSTFGGDDNAILYLLPWIPTPFWYNMFSYPTAKRWYPQMRTNDASFGVRTNQFGFTISWASGLTVVVEACTNLANPVWYPLSTITLTTGSSDFSDLQWTNYPSRFYRIRSP